MEKRANYTKTATCRTLWVLFNELSYWPIMRLKSLVPYEGMAMPSLGITYRKMFKVSFVEKYGIKLDKFIGKFPGVFLYNAKKNYVMLLDHVQDKYLVLLYLVFSVDN